MGILDIFKIFSKNDKNNNNINPLEQERINNISNSKNVLYNKVYNDVYTAIKREYVNNKRESYIYVNIHELSITNLDNDQKHRIALKATYDSARELGININAGLDIEYPYINIRIYYE